MFEFSGNILNQNYSFFTDNPDAGSLFSNILLIETITIIEELFSKNITLITKLQFLTLTSRISSNSY